jgi:isoleucyl-tRNA synthetase
MNSKYKEYKGLNLTDIEKHIQDKWQKENTFSESLKTRQGHKPFIFFEGPPSANGKPGIHHVMARTIKDIFCRYKSLKGYYVSRKAGWDTHGLPVELQVEKALGITKEDIGKKITVEQYNKACRESVMQFKDLWDRLTIQMGYWVDLQDPYITFKNKYIESVWWLLGQIYDKGLLYKGYTIQPYSPAAGTGLSSHELNMPGCYRDVKDTTCIAQFHVKKEQTTDNEIINRLKDKIDYTYFLAWTTTPWTLPSNTALAVGEKIDYCAVETFNPYTSKQVVVFVAKNLLYTLVKKENENKDFDTYKAEDKDVPFRVLFECKGKDLVGIDYEQLIPFVRPIETEGESFKVISGDYVSTEDGTGIVHIAPTFGADDARVAKMANIAPLHLIDKNGKLQPMVDRTGKFFLLKDLDDDYVAKYVDKQLYSKYEGRFVKNAYDDKLTDKDTTLDIDLCVELKKDNKVFKIEKHTHSYPHCWRTDKPVLYYPLDSWFIKTTTVRDQLIELNKTINWKPKATGTGRFGNWLENLVDWNLSRSRFWGTPLPIWRTEDGKEEKFISSVEQLSNEIDKSIAKGFMQDNSYKTKDYEAFDLHRPYIDNVVLVSESGKPMKRETDLIDVWFDSGAMPFAQRHYPFECTTEELKEKYFPADFIAEGVDQTRGWFFTLHTIATMVMGEVAYKNVVSNGLVLDKQGNKMSKRLGNAVDPFEMMDKYGADATRWYMISNSQPWDNLKFDPAGIDEIRRKFFGTLYNTYSFFALYANIDGFEYKEKEIDYALRPEIDRWILSLLNTLIKDVDEDLDNYEPTRAARRITNFVCEDLSNWYVRLCRRRFWKGEYTQDKISAYQTLYRCLEVVSKLGSVFAPFFMDEIYCNLNNVSHKDNYTSVHLASFPEYNANEIDKELEQRMSLAQKICSLVLSLRKRHNLKVRQPLAKIMIPCDKENKERIEKVKNLILSEVNVKDIVYIDLHNNVLSKTIKANFKTLGPKFGKQMKTLASKIATFTQDEISDLETNGKIQIDLEGQAVELSIEDVEIATKDIEGWVVANEGLLTVALDTTITDALYKESVSRELVNRIQNIRKEKDFEVTDNIIVEIQYDDLLKQVIEMYHDYICTEILAKELKLVDKVNNPIAKIDAIEGKELDIEIRKA